MKWNYDVDTDVDGESSTSSSSSGSSESDHVDVLHQGIKKQKVFRTSVQRTAEECVYGLHRKTWHVMICSGDSQPQLPQWQGRALKTACGRSIHKSRIQLVADFTLESFQSMCSHVGCRKGFCSVGILDDSDL